jgi:CTP:molybdopterin cytidylyltransferase MocA
MGEATVIILHPRPAETGGPLTVLLDEARSRLAEHQAGLFARAGADQVRVDRSPPVTTFAARLEGLARPLRGGLVLLGAGGATRLTLGDARRLVAVAAGGGRRALTNNRYSSDVCAIADAAALRDLPPLAGDNALARWLAEEAGFAVHELHARERLAFDLDTPLDLALLALLPRPPAGLGRLAADRQLAVPRLAELRALARDPHRELLVFGRSSAAALRWLERHTACRVRFLAEERGLRTSRKGQRAPRATLGRLLDQRGPDALAAIVGELADGAILDSRVLLADRLGADEGRWPGAEDRFASDLLRPGDVVDPWLRALTAAAAATTTPILLGGHTLLGPGLPPLLAWEPARRACRMPAHARMAAMPGGVRVSLP